MRNLKKILALALVFALGFTFTASAADFTDAAEIGANYVDDVNMLVELGVIAGYPDGSFGPQKNITRAEFAKMAYTIKYGSDTDGNLFAAQKSNFTDVEGNANVAWAKGYINYCANQKIVSGVGNGKFNPGGNITVAEATKMLLVILGCDPAKEGFTGANWVANVTAKAIDLGIYNGWTGDPSVLATRELVAKLMHNTIFSSVYTYSAITGAGSQLDALGQDYNKTLGEVTMNLQKVTGIVVANERYSLATDEEGEELQVTIPNVKEDESVVYFEKKDDKGNTYYDTITLDRALDDDMLGAKVNVYFTADTIENSGRLNYKNIEVIGNVLVHSDTVAYTVPAIATKIMPDGESTSNSTIRPYISFTVDGVEKQIVASKDVAKLPKNVDAGDSAKNPTEAALVGAEFNKYAYMLNGQTVTDDGDYDWMKVEDKNGNLIYSDTAFIDG
ncbi:MAG: S-layer homology domain-containing protein, partial [Oscillospiraceae bacterium]|nr:S-layer homology domain-containing protein [Oscillospiraceae bacterium]